MHRCMAASYGSINLGFQVVLYTSRNYHIGDINLFYINIRENVAERIQAFLIENK